MMIYIKKNPFTGERDDRFFNDRDDRIIFGTLFQNLHENIYMKV